MTKKTGWWFFFELPTVRGLVCNFRLLLSSKMFEFFFLLLKKKHSSYELWVKIYLKAHISHTPIININTKQSDNSVSTSLAVYIWIVVENETNNNKCNETAMQPNANKNETNEQDREIFIRKGTQRSYCILFLAEKKTETIKTSSLSQCCMNGSSKHSHTHAHIYVCARCRISCCIDGISSERRKDKNMSNTQSTERTGEWRKKKKTNTAKD